MATVITKNSSTASSVPAGGSLVQGELAVNVTDKKLYTKDSTGAVVKVVGSLGNQEANAVAVTGGTINGTTIGGTTPAAGTFTSVTASTSASLTSPVITGGTINNTVIGGTTPQAITGTSITATTGFSGPLTGAVTGNVTGNLTGNVTGNVTGNLTGNVTASSGTSTFNNVTINGTLDMNAGTAGTITGLPTPTNAGDAAPKSYVDTAISNLIGTAPATLDTLGEIADALNDDANIAATLTNQIATKVSKSGDTMSGALAMGSNKITGLGTPTAGTDASTKDYVDTQRDTRLALSGGTMTGAIAMGTNKITGLGDPTANQDAATKVYVDGILGSATSAAASAAAAATSASNAATSASNASTSETNAAASASAAAASYDSFDDRYLGPKSSNPTLDNDGNALLTGALYFNTTAGEMRVWNGSTWLATYLPASGYLPTGGGTLSGDLTLNAQSDLRFADADSSNWVAFQAPSTVASNITWTLPAADGTSGQVLSTNGTGTLSWTTASPASATSVSEGVVYGRTIFYGNTSLGGLAMQAVTGTGNTAVGALAYRAEGGSAATNNTIIGAFSAPNLSTGGSNSTLGNSAGSSLTTGTQNTLLGASAGASGTNNLTTGSNNIIVGYNAAASSATVSNTITLGNSSITTLRCQVTTITSLSDARDKANISDLPAGLTFINALRPVAFDWNMRDGGKVGQHDTGFIAQDLKAAQESTGINIPGLVFEDNPDRLEAGYGKLIPVLVKAIQELNAKVGVLEAQLKGN